MGRRGGHVAWACWSSAPRQVSRSDALGRQIRTGTANRRPASTGFDEGLGSDGRPASCFPTDGLAPGDRRPRATPPDSPTPSCPGHGAPHPSRRSPSAIPPLVPNPVTPPNRTVPDRFGKGTVKRVPGFVQFGWNSRFVSPVKWSEVGSGHAPRSASTNPAGPVWAVIAAATALASSPVSARTTWPAPSPPCPRTPSPGRSTDSTGALDATV